MCVGASDCRRPRRSTRRAAARTTDHSVYKRVRVALSLSVLLLVLGSPGALAADGRAEGQQIHQDHPTWPLPAGTDNGPAVWSEVGAPYAASVSLITADGSFAPRNHGPAISVWLFDADAARL